METIIIIILALALAVLAVLYFRLRADYKELNNAFEINATKYMDYALFEQENKRLTAQLDRLATDADKTDKELFEQTKHNGGLHKAIDELRAEKRELQRCYDAQLAQAKIDDEEIIALRRANEELLIKYNRYHRKQGADGRFVKKGGSNE